MEIRNYHHDLPCWSIIFECILINQLLVLLETFASLVWV